MRSRNTTILCTDSPMKNCEAIITYDLDFDHLEIPREEP